MQIIKLNNGSVVVLCKTWMRTKSKPDWWKKRLWTWLTISAFLFTVFLFYILFLTIPFNGNRIIYYNLESICRWRGTYALRESLNLWNFIQNLQIWSYYLDISQTNILSNPSEHKQENSDILLPICLVTAKRHLIPMPVMM